jgi:hypothetical protein
VKFLIISVWRFSLHICSYRGQSALSNLYRVGLSPTVECKLSRIMAPTKATNLKTLSPRKDYVSLTTVLIHIYILGNGSYSAIDLTVTDPSLLLDFSWKVHVWVELSLVMNLVVCKPNTRLLFYLKWCAQQQPADLCWD